MRPFWGDCQPECFKVELSKKSAALFYATTTKREVVLQDKTFQWKMFRWKQPILSEFTAMTDGKGDGKIYFNKFILFSTNKITKDGDRGQETTQSMGNIMGNSSTDVKWRLTVVATKVSFLYNSYLTFNALSKYYTKLSFTLTSYVCWSEMALNFAFKKVYKYTTLTHCKDQDFNSTNSI